jgi:hypothetical protein
MYPFPSFVTNQNMTETSDASVCILPEINSYIFKSKPCYKTTNNGMMHLIQAM